MSNFKTLAVASILAITGVLGITQKADAMQCFDGNGYRMCFEQVAQNGQFNTWNVGVRNAYTDEYMHVTCYGKAVSDWESEGGFSQSEAQDLADYFCSL